VSDEFFDLGYSPDGRARPIIHIMLRGALPQKSDYWATFGANGISAPKTILIYF
jgi:hypothetical protein